jgi:hypothetical protein
MTGVAELDDDEDSSSSLEFRLLEIDSCLEQVYTAVDDISEAIQVPSSAQRSNDDDIVVDVDFRHLTSVLREAVQKASRAHDLLDEAVPELSHRHRSLKYNNNNNNNNSGTGSGDDYGTKQAPAALHVGEVLPRCCPLLDAWSKLSQAGHNLRAAAARNTRMKHQTDLPNHRRKRAEGMVPTPPTPVELKEAPQRAQYLLDRMEDTSGLALALSPPPTQAYHSVMECWAYSQEHRRATMAEGVFQRLHGTTSSSSLTSTPTALPPHGNKRQPHRQQFQQRRHRPSLDSHRIMVHAWGRTTRDPRAAFHATGHLMRMVKLVQQQQNQQHQNQQHQQQHHHNDGDEYQYPRGDAFEAGDRKDYDEDDNDVEDRRIEPTIDDFRVVMEAWTRAE